MGLQSASTVVCALYARSAVGVESASTVVSALHARSAVGHQSASTVVYALSARSAVGHQSASTVVSAIDARSAVGRQYASTVVYANNARSAVVQQYASTVVGAVHARSAVGHKYVSMVVYAIDAKIAARRNSGTNVSSSTYYVMTPTPNNTHASQLTTNEPTIRSNNSALLASNPSVVALALSTYTKPPFTAAVHKTRRQHTNCPYRNKNRLTGGVVTPRHVVPAPCGRLRSKREVIVRFETVYA